MSVKLLTEHNLEFLSLTWGYTGSSESTLVKTPQCWKSHVAAHIHLLHPDILDYSKSVLLSCCNRPAQIFSQKGPYSKYVIIIIDTFYSYFSW